MTKVLVYITSPDQPPLPPALCHSSCPTASNASSISHWISFSPTRHSFKSTKKIQHGLHQVPRRRHPGRCPRYGLDHQPDGPSRGRRRQQHHRDPADCYQPAELCRLRCRLGSFDARARGLSKHCWNPGRVHTFDVSIRLTCSRSLQSARCDMWPGLN